MTPDTVLLQLLPGSEELYALTHFQACIRSLTQSCSLVHSPVNNLALKRIQIDHSYVQDYIKCIAYYL